MPVGRRKNEFNILVVEGDEAVFNELKEGMSDTNYRLWRTATGAEALRLANEGYFTAVISELLLPDINGIELVKRIKEISKQINIIMLTRYTVLNDLAVKAMEEGAFAYIQKPFNMAEVKLVLRRAIENSVLLIQAERKNYYQDISRLDGLTGVYNHRYFYEMLDWTINHLRRFPQTFSLFMIDADHFKQYNDTHGHVGGDKVLCSLARLFEQSLRDIDMVFRYGGEEFAIIVTQAQAKDAEKVAQRLVESARKKLPITISIGLAVFPLHAQMKEHLVMRADKALYRAKELGRDRLCVFDEKIDL
jgi:two-component system, cell cycle response regulator